MQKLFQRSLKLQITLASVLLVASAVAGVVFYMQHGMARLSRDEQYHNASHLLESVLVSVENQYSSILFHKKSMLEARKNELHSVISMAYATLESYAQLVETGQLSKEEAQAQAIKELQKFRYRDGVGYIWINDMSRPFARMVMHPTMTELDNQILDASEFNCALGRDENLFNAFVDVVNAQDEGFVDYLWPKPTAEGLTARQPKISFVKGFAPWGWVIGSGLYVDDLDQHVRRLVGEVLDELNKTFGRIKIADSGYIFIFTGEREMIHHPLYKGTQLNTMINPATGNYILDDLIAASQHEDGKIEYIWNKPQQSDDFIYKKIAFVSHFAPLDWYIGSSFYVDEVERPTRELRRKALLFSLLFLALAMLLALYAAHTITKPLQGIMTVFALGAKGDYSARLTTSRRDEFGKLATYFNDFMAEIADAHKRLTRSENRFRSLFEKSADARLIIEGKHVIDCNEAAVKMIRGTSKEDVLQKNPAQLSPEFQPDGRKSADKTDEIFSFINEKENYRFLWQFTRMDGEEFPAEVELTPIPYDGRKIIHVLWRDMTHQKEIEEQLVQAQKMEAIGTLSGGIAHDFNNILSAIFGYTELAELQVKDNPKLANNLNEVLQAAKRARELVKQILTFSRRAEQEKQPLQISLIVKEALKLLRSSIPTTINIKTNIVSQATVLADPTQIHQIVMNLCTNAYHAMRAKGGILAVSLTEMEMFPGEQLSEIDLASGKYLRLEVTDTGTGMDEKIRKKIFEPYFTTKGAGEGTGLGLAVVHGIVTSHNGQIHVYSEPGHGTTFNVYLPIVAKQQSEATVTAGKEKITRGSERIMFVDDEEKLNNVANDFFSVYGYTIDTFTDPLLALENFAAQPGVYSLVITDMAMPSMTGEEMAKKMMVMQPDLHVILCTGYSETINKEKAEEAGFRRYFQKPVVMSRLVKSVREILDNGE
ncbi:MAG: cache domain-containing protein [Proteobacteria bacterium]|nr:cache domain-containing protein [Pseudomonadota bacterium]MBU1233323.1 cache domain-containing protein [Pseudomonadota bacterium]MBU1420337.1 cache domain-containing protein [Pseudomonadota bacterium]MBU1456714.1 cache domain-containing protein [Pseudomonadota bacterium]